MGWRKKLKKTILLAFESKCCICGYNKCYEALEFHHLEPLKKDFSISNFKFKNYVDIIKELQKCICVCGNCHREIHNNITKIDNIIMFNTSYLNKIINTFKTNKK